MDWQPPELRDRVARPRRVVSFGKSALLTDSSHPVESQGEDHGCPLTGTDEAGSWERSPGAVGGEGRLVLGPGCVKGMTATVSDRI